MKNNRVKRGFPEIIVGKRGETWLTLGNAAKLNGVKRRSLGVNMYRRGETWLTWGKCGVTGLNVGYLG